MAKGGPRDGAGRKPGVPNKRTAAKAAEVETSGLTPLDYMLTVLRDAGSTADDRKWAAEKAAPYVHAKLASVEHKGGLNLVHELTTKEQRDAAVAAAARADR